MSATIDPSAPAPFEAAEALALSTLTDILRDPEATHTERRLAATAVLRHAAALRATDRSSGRCGPRGTRNFEFDVPLDRRSGRASADSPPAHAPAEPDQTTLDSTAAAIEPLTPRAPDPFEQLCQSEHTLSAVSRLLTLAGTPRGVRSLRPSRDIPELITPATDG